MDALVRKLEFQRQQHNDLTSKRLENRGSSLIPEHYALTLLTFKDTASPFLIHVILNPMFFFPQMKQYIFNFFFVYKLPVSPVVCEKGCSVCSNLRCVSPPTH